MGANHATLWSHRANLLTLSICKGSTYCEHSMEIRILGNDSFGNNYLAGGNGPIPFFVLVAPTPIVSRFE